jgi:D-alanine-D-alanine ligase
MDDDAVCDVADPARLVEELRRRAAALGGEAFAEQYIEGREFNVAVLAGPGGPQVLPPAEMRFLDFPPGKPHIVGYRAKWVEDSFEYRNTVRTFEARPGDHALHLQLIELATACWHRFGLRGYARVDFRVDAAGRPWVLEVNANPCLAPDAGFLAAATAGGLSLRDVLGRILADVSAMRRA